MAGKIAIAFGMAAFLVLAVGCSNDPRKFSPDSCDAECEAQMQKAREYLAENYPTRDQMLSVHECVTSRTGYEYDELPADFGPDRLMEPNPTPANRIEEDTPFRMVEKVLVAVGQRKPLRERVHSAFNECIFDLGLEDRFVPPWDQEAARPANT